MAFLSSNSSTDGEPPKNVTIPSPRDQTSLDTSPLASIDNYVQYNVTMIAMNAVGASQPSRPILFTKIIGMYVFAYVCISLLWGLQVLSQKLTSHVQVPCESLSMVKVIKS